MGKASDFATAINRYEDGVEYVTYEDDEEAAELDGDAKKMAIALLNNCAMAKLRNGDPNSAKFDCTKCLQYDAENVKAIYRRGQAELDMGNYAACVEDATRCAELDSSNKEAEQLKRKALDAEKKVKQKEKALYGKM